MPIDYKNRKPSGYWTKERCKEISLQCFTKKEFSERNESAYKKALQNGWLDSISKHFITIGHKFKRLVYSYEFSDNCVYIGLTYNEDQRHCQHMNMQKSPVFKHIKKSNLIPIKIILSKGYIDVNKALKLERNIKTKYQKDGWILLNSDRRDVSLGTLNIRKWTKEVCINEALKYTNRWEFQCNSRGAYFSSYKNGWLDEVCFHMNILKKPMESWTYEECLEISSKYRNRQDFCRNANGAYKAAIKNDWLDDICPSTKKYGYWTKDRIKDIMKEFDQISKLQKGYPGAYMAIQRNGWKKELYPNSKTR